MGQPSTTTPVSDHLKNAGGPPLRSSETMSQRLRAVNEPSSADVRPRRRRGRWWLRGLAFLGILAVATFLTWPRLRSVAIENPLRDLEFQAAERGQLIFSIVEKGEIEAAKSADIVCRVRSSGRGSAAASSIKWLIDDGAVVNKGDVVVRLDDAGLQEQMQNQEIVVAEKRELLIRAEHDEEIIESQNRIDLQAAANAVKLAQISLNKYVEGDLEQKRKDVQGRMTLAESDLMQWRERAEWTQRMVKRGYLSSTQAQSDESRLQGATIGLQRLKEEQRVLEAFESQFMLLDLQNRLAQAREALHVATIQAKSKKSQANARYQAALSVLRQEENKLGDVLEDIDHCTITAPNDGMILFNIPDQWRSSSQQNLVALGEPVREGQKLMRIPDLRHVLVRLKVHEALVPRLRVDQVRKTGFSELLHGSMLACAPGFERLGTTIAAPHAHDDLLDFDDEVIEGGLGARVRIPASEKPLAGHVKWVSAVNSSNDWLSSDVKVYPTLVAIDEHFAGLRPGMSAEVTILVEERDNVLRLPVHSVLETGGVKFCYVKVEDEIEKRVLRTGLNNNRFVEVLETSELAEGDLVVQNPRQLAERLGDLHGAYQDPAQGIKKNEKKPKQTAAK